MKNKDIAKKILDLVKEDNITYLTHCATRLRLNVKDENSIDYRHGAVWAAFNPKNAGAEK